MRVAVRHPTLSDLVVPQITSKWRDALLVVGGSLLTAAAAQVMVPLPFTPIPLTGQTFAVLLTGTVLGWKRGAAAQMLYLSQAAVGLPVLAEHPSSFATLLGPTGGYLAAFPLAAAFTGFLAQKGWDRRFWTMLISMILGTLIIYAVGLAWLTMYVPANKVVAAGMLPFLPGDLIKAAAAATAVPLVWRRRR